MKVRFAAKINISSSFVPNFADLHAYVRKGGVAGWRLFWAYPVQARVEFFLSNCFKSTSSKRLM